MKICFDGKDLELTLESMEQKSWKWSGGTIVVWSENPLRCTTQDENDLIFIVIFFPYILIPINVKNFVSAIF